LITAKKVWLIKIDYGILNWNRLKIVIPKTVGLNISLPFNQVFEYLSNLRYLHYNTTETGYICS